MPNSYFQFKKFVIHQDKTAMKVGTDGVLLGSWVDISGARRILDIGTGTGLLAIMCAQRTVNSFIDAVEIDEDAFVQANENFCDSPWKERLKVYHVDFMNFNCLDHQKYDLIVSNPPFFNGSQKNSCIRKNQARHTDSLSHKHLIEKAVTLLTSSGKFTVILPFDVKDAFEKYTITKGLHLRRILYIKPTPAKDAKRVLMEFCFEEGLAEEKVLIVEEFGRHLYSEDYRNLLKDFYLDF